MNKKFSIDLEPTWENLCNAAQTGHLPAKELMPACIIADKIRQAQKSGAKSVTFTFEDDGSINLEIQEKE